MIVSQASVVRSIINHANLKQEWLCLFSVLVWLYTQPLEDHTEKNGLEPLD